MISLSYSDFLQTMEQQEFIALKERLAPSGMPHVETREMRDEEIDALSMEQAQELVALYGSTTLIPLPEREKQFFNWLRNNDLPVWKDLWGETEEGSYYVSLSHLTSFLPKQRGFPICDLMENDNYFFTPEDITPEDGKIYVDSALDIITEQGQLAMDQAFMVEVWRAAIDQWRFAWMYRLPLTEVKKMVHWLITEGLLNVPQQRAEEEGDGIAQTNGIADNE